MIPCLSKVDSKESINRLYDILFKVRKKFGNENIDKYEARILISVSYCLLEMKEYYLAIETIKTVIKKDPSCVDHLCFLGRVYIELGNMKEAELSFKEVENILKTCNLTEEQKNEIILMNKSHLLIASGSWKEAYNILTTIISTYPDNFLAVNNLCMALLYQGNLQEAVSLLESLVNRCPDTAGVCESILLNLTTLYELASECNEEKKRKLVENILIHGGDNFPIECLKF